MLATAMLALASAAQAAVVPSTVATRASAPSSRRLLPSARCAARSTTHGRAASRPSWPRQRPQRRPRQPLSGPATLMVRVRSRGRLMRWRRVTGRLPHSWRLLPRRTATARRGPPAAAQMQTRARLRPPTVRCRRGPCRVIRRATPSPRSSAPRLRRSALAARPAVATPRSKRRSGPRGRLLLRRCVPPMRWLRESLPAQHLQQRRPPLRLQSHLQLHRQPRHQQPQQRWQTLPPPPPVPAACESALGLAAPRACRRLSMHWTRPI